MDWSSNRPTDRVYPRLRRSRRPRRDRHYLRGLRPQLLLWTILPLTLILIVISFLGVYGHQRAMRDLVAQRDTRMVTVAAGQIGQRLERRLDVLRLLADSSGDMDAESPRRAGDSASSSAVAAFGGRVAVIEESGTWLKAYPHRAAWSGQESLARDLAQEAARDGEVAFSAVVEDAPDGIGYVLMAVASPDGRRVLVGAVAVEQLRIRSVMSALMAGPRATAYLVDSQGRVLWHPDPAQIGEDRSGEEEAVGSAPPLTGRVASGVVAVGQGAAGALFHKDPGLGEVVTSYAPIPPVGWGLVVTEPWSDVTGPMMQFSLVAPLLVLAAAVVSLLAITFGVQRIIRPLQALHHQVGRVAWGDFEAVESPVGGIQEIEDLREALRMMAGQIRRYQRGLRNYIGAMTQGQEEERARLARELHDDTTQSLIAIHQQVEMAQKALSRDPERAAARLTAVRETVTATLEGVRRFTRDLRPLYLEDLGLVPALEMLVRDLEERTRELAGHRGPVETGEHGGTPERPPADVSARAGPSTRVDGPGLQATFHVQGAVQRLDPDLELAVYRIVQEALSNVSKHAQASQVSVILAFEKDSVTVTVEDDGVGFEAPERPNELAGQGHFGLVGMRERALLAGGRLSIESRVNGGRGTRISAYFKTPRESSP